jgi:class 3 adenylate cyclase
VSSPETTRRIRSRLAKAISVFAALISARRRNRVRSASPIAALAALLAVSAAAAVVAHALSATTPVRFAENLLYDLRLALTAKPAASPIIIVKIDDEAIADMRSQSECGCISPIDKIWLADVIAGVSQRGAAIVGVDYLIDTFRTDAEFRTYAARLADVAAPVVVVADPGLRPGVDFPASDKTRFADARALFKDDYDDIVRRYDPTPPGSLSFAAAILEQLGVDYPEEPFAIAYRASAGGAAENTGALATSVSAHIVRDLPDTFFQGKIVLIGRVTRSETPDSDTLLEDVHATPLRFLPGHHDGTPGVEVHAHALDQMLVGDRIARPAPAIAIAVLLAAALAGAAFGRSSYAWRTTVLIMLLGLTAAAAGAAGLLWTAGVMVDLAAPFLSFTVAYLITGRITATQLREDRALYAGTLNRYLAPQVINRIVEGSEPVEIGAASRDITVLATDVEDFSVLVGTCPPALFAQIMNGYFDGVIDVLWKHEAMLDKLTGDGLIAIFGAPTEQPDHPARAIACARDIDAFAEAYRSRIASETGVPFGRTRMGLHSGEALVGNFGGDKRFNYTAYGETVVIAARLEAANKQFGSRILASAETVRLAGLEPGARDVGAITLKGVASAVAAFSIA